MISTQGAFEPTQICLEGLIPGSVSKVPKRRRIFSGCVSLRLRIGEPQRPQKHRLRNSWQLLESARTTIRSCAPLVPFSVSGACDEHFVVGD